MRSALKTILIVLDGQALNTSTTIDFPQGTTLHQEFENTSHLYHSQGFFCHSVPPFFSPKGLFMILQI